MQNPTKETTLTTLRLSYSIFFDRMTSKGHGVNAVHRPWKYQATKKLKGFYFIS